MSENERDAVIGKAVRQLKEAKNEHAALIAKARGMGARMGAMADALNSEPHRVIVGPENRLLRNPQEYLVFPSTPLPAIEEVTQVTDAIRATAEKVERLESEARSLGL